MSLKPGDIYVSHIDNKQYKVMVVFSDHSFLSSPNLEEKEIGYENMAGDNLPHALETIAAKTSANWIAEQNIHDYDPVKLSYLQIQPLKYEGQKGAKGLKYDNGKLIANVLFEYFPRALKEVTNIATYGANKYARASWLTVPDAKTRYTDAMVRHQLEVGINGNRSKDEESGLLHLSHFAWNALAILELELREMEKEVNGQRISSN